VKKVKKEEKETQKPTIWVSNFFLPKSGFQLNFQKFAWSKNGKG